MHDEESTSSQILEIIDTNVRKTYKGYIGKKMKRKRKGLTWIEDK